MNTAEKDHCDCAQHDCYNWQLCWPQGLWLLEGFLFAFARILILLNYNNKNYCWDVPLPPSKGSHFTQIAVSLLPILWLTTHRHTRAHPFDYFGKGCMPNIKEQWGRGGPLTASSLDPIYQKCQPISWQSRVLVSLRNFSKEISYQWQTRCFYFSIKVDESLLLHHSSCVNPSGLKSFLN